MHVCGPYCGTSSSMSCTKQASTGERQIRQTSSPVTPCIASLVVPVRGGMAYRLDHIDWFCSTVYYSCCTTFDE